MNILFLCTANSCRSIMAEALLRHRLAAGFGEMPEEALSNVPREVFGELLGKITVQSAGSHPLGAINAHALAALQAAGISVNALASKSWHSLSVAPDIVITLCDAAQSEPCPVFLGSAMRSHWGMADPALAKGEALAQAFSTAIEVLQKRLAALCILLSGEEAKNLNGVFKNPETLQQRLDYIGKL